MLLMSPHLPNAGFLVPSGLWTAPRHRGPTRLAQDHREPGAPVSVSFSAHRLGVGPSGCSSAIIWSLILNRAGDSCRPGSRGDQWLCAESMNEANSMWLSVPGLGLLQGGASVSWHQLRPLRPHRSPGDSISAWLPVVRGAEAADGAQPQSTGCN